MLYCKTLEQRMKNIREERIRILDQISELTKLDKNNVSQYRKYGEELMDNLAELRDIRRLLKIFRGLGGSAMSEVLTLEMYQDLKAQGLSDKEIMQKLNVDNNKLYKFKRENGLSRPRKRKTKSVTEITEEIKETPVKQESIHSEFEEIKAMIKQLQDENAILKEENEKLHNELWTDRINRIFLMQMEFDAMVIEKHGLDMEQYKDEQLLALIVEIAETANEEQSFKYWKLQKEVDREKLLEELVDILHMTASVGLHNGFNEDIVIEVDKLGPVTVQFLAIIKNAIELMEYKNEELKKLNFNKLMNLFVGLSQMLGFTWQEIEAAYLKKHAENVERQKNGY